MTLTFMRTSGRREHSIAACDQYQLVGGVDARHDLYDARIDAPGFAIDALEPGDLGLIGQRGTRVDRQVQPMTADLLPGGHGL
jgi:hypothetical protein